MRSFAKPITAGTDWQCPFSAMRKVSVRSEDTLTGCMNQFYKPDNMVISAAGCFDPARFRELVENAFTITGKAEKHDFNYGSPAGERSFNLLKRMLNKRISASASPDLQPNPTGSIRFIC